MILSILSYPWTIEILPAATVEAVYGTETAAVTDFKNKKIVFCDDKLDYLHIVHELTHVFKYYCCIEELDLDEDDFEEFMCDFIALHGQEIHRLADVLLKELKNVPRL